MALIQGCSLLIEAGSNGRLDGGLDWDASEEAAGATCLDLPNGVTESNGFSFCAEELPTAIGNWSAVEETLSLEFNPDAKVQDGAVLFTGATLGGAEDLTDVLAECAVSGEITVEMLFETGGPSAAEPIRTIFHLADEVHGAFLRIGVDEANDLVLSDPDDDSIDAEVVLAANKPIYVAVRIADEAISITSRSSGLAGTNKLSTDFVPGVGAFEPPGTLFLGDEPSGGAEWSGRIYFLGVYCTFLLDADANERGSLLVP